MSILLAFTSQQTSAVRHHLFQIAAYREAHWFVEQAQAVPGRPLLKEHRNDSLFQSAHLQ